MLSFAAIPPTTFSSSSATKCRTLPYNFWLADVVHFSTNRKDVVLCFLLLVSPFFIISFNVTTILRKKHWC